MKISLPVPEGKIFEGFYPKQICLAHPLSFECFPALKGTHLYIFIFNMNGHGGHLGHVTSIILMDFYFHVPKGLHTNFG